MHITHTRFTDGHLGDLTDFARCFITTLRVLPPWHRRFARRREAMAREIDRLDWPFDDRQRLCAYLELLTWIGLYRREVMFCTRLVSSVVSIGLAVTVMVRLVGPSEPLPVAVSSLWLTALCLPWANRLVFWLAVGQDDVAQIMGYQRQAAALRSERLSTGRTVSDELALLVPELSPAAQAECLAVSFGP